jgi:phosphatidylglycerol:prolipoprotein diacylglycerol transferase
MHLLAIDRVMFTLGPFTIHWYGFIIAMGIVVAVLLSQLEARRLRINPEIFLDGVMWGVPISIICARLYYVIFEWDKYADRPLDAFKIWEGGLAIHGAIIGAILTIYIFHRKTKLSFFKLADITVPCILIAQAIGRWGNFINQEAHGGPVTKEFLQSLQLPSFIIDQMLIKGVYYHPTFLYESMWNLLGFLVLIYLWRRNLYQGEVFLTYLVWYSVGRFFVEGLRTDSLMLGDLKMAQVISAAAIIFAICFFVYRRFKEKKPPRYLEA